MYIAAIMRNWCKTTINQSYSPDCRHWLTKSTTLKDVCPTVQETFTVSMQRLCLLVYSKDMRDS